MWSRSRSALDPSSVIAAPLTVTRPAWISSSAFLRLAIPACDRIFCSLSSGIFRGRIFRRRFRLGFFHQLQTPELLALLERRRLAQVLKPELDQKLRGRFVSDRTTDDALASSLSDQLPLGQRLQHARAL